LGILIALAVTTESFCPGSAAQTNSPTSGTVISWGDQVISYVQPGTRFQTIAAGGSYSLGLTSDGTVAAWGDNYFGQSTVPTTLTGVIAIAAGTLHSLALTPDRTADSWGRHRCGQRKAPDSAPRVFALPARSQ